MTLCRPNSKASIKLSRPQGLDTETWNYVEPLFQALREVEHQIGRFRFYGYLTAVYRTFEEWKDLRISKTMTRHLVEIFDTPSRKGTSPIRTLIDATFPGLNSKTKSRWSRALEFAALRKTTPDDLPKLFKKYSGIAGCARLATKEKPKNNIYRDDWI